MAEINLAELQLIHDLAYWGLGHVRQAVPVASRRESYMDHENALGKLSAMIEEIKRDKENQERLLREERERQELEQGQPVPETREGAVEGDRDVQTHEAKKEGEMIDD